jgi:hypothetical protein
MSVRAIVEQPSRQIADALARFERVFSYPLGASTRFRISHGEDYVRFFRAMGQGTVFVAERNGEVLGTIGAALREIAAPGGRVASALYIGDVKVRPGPESGFTLLRLALAVRRWAETRVAAAFGVAMDGTAMTPERYTGRLGIPPFVEIGRIMVLRVACEGVVTPRAEYECSDTEAAATHRRLVHEGYATVGGVAQERSQIAPLWLRHPAGSACGLLEDTRKAKRLYTLEGAELLSAHLSFFAFEDVGGAVDLLQQARSRARRLGFPALFCAIPQSQVEGLTAALPRGAATPAPATVYGMGFPSGFAWHINTAEI